MKPTTVSTFPPGGKRPGTGRPPVFQKQLEEARQLAKRLRAGALVGYAEYADEYPNLMLLAISLAKGEHPSSQEPNIPLLKSLLELMPKIASEEHADDDSPISKMLQNLKRNIVNITQVNIEQVVAGDDAGRTVTVEGEYQS